MRIRELKMSAHHRMARACDIESKDPTGSVTNVPDPCAILRRKIMASFRTDKSLHQTLEALFP
jgi:hypothetical protein